MKQTSAVSDLSYEERVTAAAKGLSEHDEGPDAWEFHKGDIHESDWRDAARAALTAAGLPDLLHVLEQRDKEVERLTGELSTIQIVADAHGQEVHEGLMRHRLDAIEKRARTVLNSPDEKQATPPRTPPMTDSRRRWLGVFVFCLCLAALVLFVVPLIDWTEWPRA